MAKVKVGLYAEEEKIKIIEEFLAGTEFTKSSFLALAISLMADEIEAYLAPDPYEDDPNVDWSNTEKEVKDYTFFKSFALQTVAFRKEQAAKIKGGK
jgi:hypothetical protein